MNTVAKSAQLYITPTRSLSDKEFHCNTVSEKKMGLRRARGAKTGKTAKLAALIIGSSSQLTNDRTKGRKTLDMR